MAGRWGFFTEDKPWDQSRNLFIVLDERFAGGRVGVVAPLEITTRERGMAIDAPTLTQTYEQARDNIPDVDEFLQAALDCAWGLGMRPKGWNDRASDQELAAVRYHLEDMRALAKVPALIRDKP